MGKMKQFGILVASMVYDRRLRNEQIIGELKSIYPRTSVSWLADQVRAVRADPKTWRDFGGRNTG